MIAQPSRVALALCLVLATPQQAAPVNGAQVPPPGPAAPSGGQCPVHEKVTTLGVWFEANKSVTALDPIRTIKPPDTATFSAMRLQLVPVNLGDRTWRLVIRDPRQRTLAVLTASDFIGNGGAPATRWTGILRAPRVILDLEDAAGDVKLKAEAALALPESTNGAPVFSQPPGSPMWKALHGDNTPTSFANEIIQRSGESVGMVQSAAYIGGQKKTWCCSGVMVGPDLFLTNWHCGGAEGVTEDSYWDAACDNAIIDLGWDEGAVRRQLSCSKIEAKDKDRDFALLRVRPALGEGGAVRAAPARISTVTVSANHPLFVVHHPRCEVKQVSDSCSVISPSYRAWTAKDDSGLKTDLTHSCTTEVGSSGGAVFNASGQLVALHHAGFDTQAACGKADHVNKAVRIGEILSFLPQNLRQSLNVK
jgi:hypothetical protein